MSLEIESYCNQCGRWSDDALWQEGDVEYDGEVLDSYVVCPLCGHHHPLHDPRTRPRGVVNPPHQERASVTDTPSESRWGAFSDEELVVIKAGARRDFVGATDVGRAIDAEIEHEQQRRAFEVPNYRGPGVYNSDREVGPVLRVLGLGLAGDLSAKYVVVEGGVQSQENPTDYHLVPLHRFNARRDGVRAYEYVEELEESATRGEVVEITYDGLASRIRDWLHETPLSLCNAGADSCPDWDLAYALARLLLDYEPNEGDNEGDKKRLKLDGVVLVADLDRAARRLGNEHVKTLNRVLTRAMDARS